LNPRYFSTLHLKYVNFKHYLTKRRKKNIIASLLKNLRDLNRTNINSVNKK